MALIKLPDFIIIPYQLLEDNQVTLIDERLYGVIYWFSKLKNEKCTASNSLLANLVKTTPTTIQNSLTKLEEKGFIKRIFKDHSRRNRKEIIPLVVFAKVSPTDDTVSPTDDTQVSPTSDQNKNIYNKNRKEYTAEPSSADIVSLIEKFSVKNPACKNMYGNTTQRKACKFLIDTYGLERVITVIEKTLPKTNGLEFFPTITTPVQLQDKWSVLEAAIKRYMNKAKSEKEKYPIAFVS